MPFSVDDIEPIGYAPGTTGHDYAVSRAGEHVGVVRFLRAAELINEDRDPVEYIARQLNEVEDSEGFEKLAASLRATLVLR